MISIDELDIICKDIESHRIERTTSTGDTDKFSQAVCAFANDLPNTGKPGFLVVGVHDNGKRSGLQVSDELLRNLAGLRSDGNIQPLPVISVAKFTFQDGDVAVVEVLPSDLPPIRYRGRIWVRIGPRKSIATEQEERMLSERRVSSARSFDATPSMEATLDDLAIGQFEIYRRKAVDEEVIKANHRTIEEQLASLRFYDLKRNCPTIAGLLLFGKKPRYHLPCAYVQYLLLPGKTLTDIPTDQAEISGDLFTVLREMEIRIRVCIKTGLKQVSPLMEQTIFNYPELAIREILNNAIMHRDYQSNTPVRFYVFEDRIEIQNPGGLYGDVTPDTITTRNSYRNPVIAEGMKELGVVNRFGYGIQRAQSLLAENGNPPIVFDIQSNTFLAKIISRKE
jgi:ATP-dependent DNA helicase RecG